MNEVEEALREGGAKISNDHLAEEIGDLLFSVTNLTRKLGMDSEALLAAANEKFTRRFNQLENVLENEGTNIVEADIDKMEKTWEKIKKET